MGFVFQSFQLLPSLTALENVRVPLELRGAADALPLARDRLSGVGLEKRMHHYPAQLSGGEQQHLDPETNGPIEKLIFELNERFGTALVLVTHDSELARRVGRVVRMRGGEIVKDTSI